MGLEEGEEGDGGEECLHDFEIGGWLVLERTSGSLARELGFSEARV